MHIDKYKQGDEYLYDGIAFDNPVYFIHAGILNFCACGSPENNLEYIRRGLQLIKDRFHSSDNLPHHTWKHYQKLRQQVHGSESAALFFDYCTYKLNLTGHGSNVTNCWLTNEGLELLDDLTELHKQGTIPQK